jgi:hypothetical protein
MINNIMTPGLQARLLEAIANEPWLGSQRKAEAEAIKAIPLMSSVYGTPAEGAIEYFGLWNADIVPRPLKALRRADPDAVVTIRRGEAR